MPHRFFTRSFQVASHALPHVKRFVFSGSVGSDAQRFDAFLLPDDEKVKFVDHRVRGLEYTFFLEVWRHGQKFYRKAFCSDLTIDLFKSEWEKYQLEILEGTSLAHRLDSCITLDADRNISYKVRAVLDSRRVATGPQGSVETWLFIHWLGFPKVEAFSVLGGCWQREIEVLKHAAPAVHDFYSLMEPRGDLHCWVKNSRIAGAEPNRVVIDIVSSDDDDEAPPGHPEYQPAHSPAHSIPDQYYQFSDTSSGPHAQGDLSTVEYPSGSEQDSAEDGPPRAPGGPRSLRNAQEFEPPQDPRFELGDPAMPIGARPYAPRSPSPTFSVAPYDSPSYAPGRSRSRSPAANPRFASESRSRSPIRSRSASPVFHYDRNHQGVPRHPPPTYESGDEADDESDYSCEDLSSLPDSLPSDMVIS